MNKLTGGLILHPVGKTLLWLLYTYLLIFFFRKPNISLENAKGLSNEQVSKLRSELESHAERLVGEVCYGVLNFYLPCQVKL